jgi:hypothetical protein
MRTAPGPVLGRVVTFTAVLITGFGVGVGVVGVVLVLGVVDVGIIAAVGVVATCLAVAMIGLPQGPMTA